MRVAPGAGFGAERGVVYCLDARYTLYRVGCVARREGYGGEDCGCVVAVDSVIINGGFVGGPLGYGEFEVHGDLRWGAVLGWGA